MFFEDPLFITGSPAHCTIYPMVNGYLKCSFHNVLFKRTQHSVFGPSGRAVVNDVRWVAECSKLVLTCCSHGQSQDPVSQHPGLTVLSAGMLHSCSL